MSAEVPLEQRAACCNVQERGLEKQRSRLGLSRRSTGIQKVSAVPPKPSSLSLRPHASASPATMLQQISAPSQPPALLPGPTAPTAVAASEAGGTSMATAVAKRVPSPAGLGPSAIPHIDRVIALGSRRAPHLAGTRVKIYCSQGGRGIKSHHALSSTVGSDTASSRRVKQKVEALDLMIWRCECARKVITKGAPISVGSLSGQDAAKPQSKGPTGPVPGIIAHQVAARLGSTHSVPTPSDSAIETLPSSSLGGNQAPAAVQVPTSQNQQVASSSEPQGDLQMQTQRQRSSDEGELIHQLPSSAPLLAQEDSALLTQIISLPTAPQHQARPDQQPSGDLAQHMPSAAAGLNQGSLQVPQHSPSSSPSPPVSRQSSPSSASLVGLIPPTTAVTGPSPSQPPYNMISAARAASLHDNALPAVLLQDAGMPAAADSAAMGICNGQAPVSRPFGRVMDSLQPELLSQLPVLKGVLRAQSSIGLPSTPDTESLERHAALRREHSSFSRSSAMEKVQDGLHGEKLQRKEAVTTSGLLDLAMSAALPAGDLEPDIFAAFFEDSGAFDRPT